MAIWLLYPHFGAGEVRGREGGRKTERERQREKKEGEEGLGSDKENIFLIYLILKVIYDVCVGGVCV